MSYRLSVTLTRGIVAEHTSALATINYALTQRHAHIRIRKATSAGNNIQKQMKKAVGAGLRAAVDR